MIETKFKQTEIGLIPEDWDVIPLGELCEIRNGYTPSKSVESFWRGGNIPWFRMEDIRQNGRILSDSIQHITKDAVKGDLFSANSIILSTTATIGEHALLIAESLANQRFTNLKIRESLKKKIDIYFFYWYCYKIGEWCRGNINDGGLLAVNISDLLMLPLPLPPLNEQQRVVEALSNIDNLISSLSKLIEKKRLIKQGAMQQLLTGRKRLPGFDGEWKERELGLLVNIQRGSMLKSSEYLFGNVPVIAGGTTPAGFHNVANRRGRTITISASGANAGYISYYKEPIFATDCSTISEGDGYYIDFIYYSLLFNQKEIFRLQTGGAQPHIHPKDIAPLKVAIPCTYDEQVAIANILTTMDNEIESLKEEREKYLHIKEGMMHKLLTGQIRLIKAETRQTALSKTKAANVHFKRCVLAAEIADRLYGEKTFGHVKMEKLIFLTERLCHIDIDSHYHRDAAGPYDNRALRSIDSQMKKQQWFAVTKKDKGYQYQPMEKRGEHKKYFDRYYSDVLPMFDKIINTFKTSSTEQCEIVATIYSAWDDLLHGGRPFSDEDILDEVLNNWHESKRRIERSRWQKALVWMRDNGFVPQTENL